MTRKKAVAAPAVATNLLVIVIAVVIGVAVLIAAFPVIVFVAFCLVFGKVLTFWVDE